MNVLKQEAKATIFFFLQTTCFYFVCMLALLKCDKVDSAFSPANRTSHRALYLMYLTILSLWIPKHHNMPQDHKLAKLMSPGLWVETHGPEPVLDIY